ncbi:polymorphic toxin-type HINT domain-containing protein [Kutzneria buriramensis]|uniref:Intein n=1 Tax=Kutzneria buriramensis TaxID=1045776 RepID=A0A3E0G5S2_9PSEU|nr:polymorphic toxin-type HINT domain-containing protein [Kutzneria buriramensis]REH17411.1 intein [Kutzneria buriramensis]
MHFRHQHRPGGLGKALARGLTAATTVALTLSVAAPPSWAQHADAGPSSDTYAYPGRLVDDAHQIREDFCRLGYVLQGGGPALKTVAQQGFAATSAADLHTIANPSYWTNTPLHTAFQQDQTAATAKDDSLDNRHYTWDKSIPGNFTLPTMTDTGFRWSPNYYSDFGLTGFYANREMADESKLYVDLAPVAGAAAVASGTQVAKDQHLYNGQDIYNANLNVNPDESVAWGAEGPQDVWGDGKTITTGNQHADDLRIFLQNGGWPRTTLDPNSLEFRLEVEALKLRFASCDSDNPLDPDHVQAAIVRTAATEWQAELDAAAGQRATIVAAEKQSSADLATASEAMIETVGQSWIAGQLAAWQSYWTSHPELKGQPNYPKPADFTYATTEIGNARQRAAAQLPIANNAAADAKTQADNATAAQTAAANIASTNKTPYGRNLAYAQQSAQVTKASAAGAHAAATATATAVQAANAAVKDSAALQSLAKTQALALQTEFKRAAAQEAADQAHAAAAAAAAQATQAANAAATAKTDRATAEQAATAAQNAANTAAQQRAIAQQQQGIAAAKRKEADAQHAAASAAESDAQTKQDAADKAETAAQGALATSQQKESDAKAAESQAADARTAAAQAADLKDADAARAAADDAVAAAATGTSAADAANAAAAAAHKDADAAASAAAGAKSDADKATNAAVAARAAATQATAAASAARDAADNAKAAASTAKSQAAAAHSAAADAIAAATQAGQFADNANASATSAKNDAATAGANSLAAGSLAAQALSESVKTAGFAYATAQTAAAARDAAAQVVAPANDAIALGSPFRQTDDSAALAVLVGQAAKTIAQQQQAAAQARADDAAKAALAAKALADQANADAKAAATAASAAAADASAAAASAVAARASAAAAADDAAAAAQADANAANASATAAADAATANSAATTADADASAARDAATAAERDAAAAKAAAAQAQQDADNAKAAATASDQAAAAAQTAAQNAQQSATDAQNSASQAEEAARQAAEQANQVSTWTSGDRVTTVTYTPRSIGDLTADPSMMSGTCPGACDVQVKYHLHGTLLDGLQTCKTTIPQTPVCTLTLIDQRSISFDLTITYHMKVWDEIKNSLVALAKGMVQSFISCANDFSAANADCYWAAGQIAPTVIGQIAKTVSAFRTAMLLAEAAKSLPEIQQMITDFEAADGITADLATSVESDILNSLAAQEGADVASALTKADMLDELADLARARQLSRPCSFSPDTPVLMAGGDHRPIGSLQVGDEVVATDPTTGRTENHQILRTLVNRDTDLADLAVTMPDGTSSVLHTTGNHPFWDATTGSWVAAGQLPVGDALRTADGQRARVAGVREFAGSQDMYNLTVDQLHTYYVQAGHGDVLVHNTSCPVDLALGLDIEGDTHRFALARNFMDYCGTDWTSKWEGLVRAAIENHTGTTIHVNLKGFGYERNYLNQFPELTNDPLKLFLSAVSNGAKPATARGTETEMFMIAREVASGLRSWSSVNFYVADGDGWAEVPRPPEPDWKKYAPDAVRRGPLTPADD